MESGVSNYIFASSRSWNLDAFMKYRDRLPGSWQICVSAIDLEVAADRNRPRYIFFPHWSSIVPKRFLENNECVCFHMTDVPYGRGGSPLQNLISRGHRETVLTALKMTPELDAGPVYLKRPLSLDGKAEQIFRHAAEICIEMIKEIVREEPVPTPQTGDPVYFARRKPEQSALPRSGNLQEIFDHIRMLDAPGYPHAFMQYGDWMATVTDAELRNGAIEARVRIARSGHDDNEGA